MNKAGLLIIVFVLLSGCATQQRYYTKSNLNFISIGQTKEELLSRFPGQSRSRGAPPPFSIRAAQKNEGALIEVGEVLLTDGVSATVPYWFLFEDGKLIRWGQPEDWKKVEARYEINYNPTVGITQ